ncbi:MAG TPA: hypothetical protein LFV92_00225 [Rickettsia endosymbiont of Ceroptres masudai]|nr:hypothetical protein [Rickettsia endosymbiont of Ceroptres masudai]
MDPMVKPRGDNEKNLFM